jgi:hypothetical protein
VAKDNEVDIRKEIVALLLKKIEADQYPSVTMLDMVEELATPEELGRYARVLMDKINADQFPSIPMIRRLVELT